MAAEEALTGGIQERSCPFSLISNAGNKAEAFRKSGSQTCYPGLTTQKTREEIEGKGDSELGEKTGEAELRLTARGTWLPGEARGLL